MEEKKFKGTRDRISSLPQAIIHDHIFPLLPNKDIKVTTSLSKTWYHLSNSFPYLVFDNIHGFGFRLRENQCKEKQQEEEEVHKYLKYIGQTLQRFRQHSDGLQIIRKLCIHLVFRPHVAPLLDTWITLVLQYGVEEFNLDITNYQENNFYDLPRAVFNAKSMIKVASIKGCSLLHSFPYINDRSTNLVMRKICLEKVLLKQTSLSSIISCCPLIEELSIKSCMGLVNCLVISNIQKLKSLVICNCEGARNFDDVTNVKIDVPSLQTLEIQGWFSKIRIAGNCPILSDLILKDIVHELDLQEDILTRLPFLRRLSLVNIHKLTKLKVSSDTLNKLTILECKKLVELQIDGPNLLNVVYKGYLTPLHAYSSTHDTNITSARWYVTTGPNDGLVWPYREDFLVELSKFVSKMKHIEYLDLDFSKAQNFYFEELNWRVVQPPVANIYNLRLCINKITDLVYWNNYFFDDVLWICRPSTLSLQLMSGKKDYVVNSIRRIIMRYRGGDYSSCTLARLSWLHCLEDVMYVTEDGTENPLPMDGTSVPYLCSRYYTEIRFIFKW